MFDFDGDPAAFWVGVAIVVAGVLVGVVVGGVYAGEIGAVAGGFAGACVGGGVLFVIARAFDAAVRNIVYVGPLLLIIGGAVWLYLEFF